MDCVVTARRRPRASRQNGEPTDLTRRTDQIKYLLRASAEKTSAAVHPSSGHIPGPDLSDQSTVFPKSPTFIYHQPDGQAIEPPLGASNSSPAILDGQQDVEDEDESSSVYATEAVCFRPFLFLLYHFYHGSGRQR